MDAFKFDRELARRARNMLLLAQHAKHISVGFRTHLQSGGDPIGSCRFNKKPILLLAQHIDHDSVGLYAHAQGECGGEPESLEKRETTLLAQHGQRVSKILRRAADDCCYESGLIKDLDTTSIVLLIKHAERVSRKLHAYSRNLEEWRHFTWDLYCRFRETDDAYKLIEEFSIGLTPTTSYMIPHAQAALPSGWNESIYDCIHLILRCAAEKRLKNPKHIKRNMPAVKTALTTNLVATVRKHCSECSSCKPRLNTLMIGAQRHASGDCADNYIVEAITLYRPIQEVLAHEDFIQSLKK